MTFSVRGLAAAILTQVDETVAHAEELLDRYLERNNFTDDRDRRLLTELTYGTLRQRGLCDYLLRKYIPYFPQLESTAKNLLRLGVYQMLFTDRIPSYAIVNEMVNLAKQLSPQRARLANAVLRKIASQRREELIPPLSSHELGLASSLYSHPPWLIKRWAKRWGWEEALKLCVANNSTPPVSLRVNTLKTNREEAREKLAKEGFSVSSAAFSPDGLIVDASRRRLRDASTLKEGWVVYQDEASQLISYLISPLPGETILDLCAGTGGKTFHLAALMKNQGEIWATDIDEDKLMRLAEEAIKFGVSIVKTKQIDATGTPPEALIGRFDRVLVDAPCSGTGTLRRAPEIKWRLRARDLARFTHNQKKMLDFAARLVKKGGVVVYSTCSLLEEENEQVVTHFLARRSNFQLAYPQHFVAPNLLARNGFLMTSPHRHGTDGFFGAFLVKG